MVDELPEVLPVLRDNIRIEQGGLDFNQASTWVIHDTLSNQFYHVGWQEFQLLSHWQAMSPQQLIDKLKMQGVDVSLDDIKEMLVFLSNNCLIKQSMQAMLQVWHRHHSKKTHFLIWLIKNYLFFRLPLSKPDKFLSKTYPYIAFVFRKPFLIILILAEIIAIICLLPHWVEYKSSLVSFFSLKSLLLFAISMIIVKVFHELGHAYACKRYHLNVPTIGVAFLVMMPMLYTDTSESWRIRHGKQRIIVALSGLYFEFIIAVIALWVWLLLSPGVIRDVLFFMSSISLLTSLLINISPFLRFDGYHVLADILSMRNLQTRAFQLTRWRIREFIFGLQHEPPEIFRRKRRIMLYTYAVLAWLYRFILFIGIAILVYHFFFKLLGILLFVIEIFYFILNPIFQEVKVWWRYREQINFNIKIARTLLILVLLFLLLIFPWRSSIVLPATISAEQVDVFIPQDVMVKQLLVTRGQYLEKGSVIAILVSPGLDFQIQRQRLVVKKAYQALRQAELGGKFLSQKQILHREVLLAQQQLKSLLSQQQKLLIKAPISGNVTAISQSALHAVWLHGQQILLRLTAKDSYRIVAFANHEQLGKLELAQKGDFFANNMYMLKMPVTIKAISQRPLKSLLTAQSHQSMPAYLASVSPLSLFHAQNLGGHIAVKALKDDHYVPTSSIYRVSLQLASTPSQTLSHVTPGHVKIHTAYHSLLGNTIGGIYTVLLRQLNF